MDKIEVGEYVRTNNGDFAKVVKISKSITDRVIYETDKCITTGTKTLDAFSEKNIKDIVKHSKNKTDLVEVGDYVNGDEVVDKYLFNGEKPVLETTGDYTNAKCLCNSDIKSIVTKEQFESVKYNFEEEEA